MYFFNYRIKTSSFKFNSLSFYHFRFIFISTRKWSWTWYSQWRSYRCSNFYWLTFILLYFKTTRTKISYLFLYKRLSLRTWKTKNIYIILLNFILFFYNFWMICTWSRKWIKFNLLCFNRVRYIKSFFLNNRLLFFLFFH